MTHETTLDTMTPCHACPLRQLDVFKDRGRSEIDFIQAFKHDEIMVPAGTVICREGDSNVLLYTVLSGWVFRTKELGNRRQIINFGMPGDFLGLQATLDQPMGHGIEALTDVTLCRFDRTKLWALYSEHPRLAFDVTWLAAQQERSLQEHILTLGQRTAFERVAYILWHLFDQARTLGLVCRDRLDLPVRQQQLADALGLSLVHTNKTLQRLREDRAIEFSERSLKVLDEERLMRLARAKQQEPPSRPLI